jgi:hypothetical protein
MRICFSDCDRLKYLERTNTVLYYHLVKIIRRILEIYWSESSDNFKDDSLFELADDAISHFYKLGEDANPYQHRDLPKENQELKEKIKQLQEILGKK